MIRQGNQFFTLPDGEKVEVFTLSNALGGTVRISDFGGTLISLEVPDRNGAPTDVLLGWKKSADYLANPGYLGALVGRVANRIAGGSFELGGTVYRMALNDGPRPNTLHGGSGFSHCKWWVENFDGRSLALSLDSPDGDAGFPGALHVDVGYFWSDDCELAIEYRAVCDATTLVNLTNHAYFNLNGEASNDVSGLSLRIAADEYNPVDGNLIPIGIAQVGEGIPDLRRPMRFEDILNVVPGGLDHNYILGHTREWRNKCVEAASSRTGIVMTVSTDMPGVQVYMGGGLGEGYPEGKHGFYRRFAGFCLETQAWPDAPHHPDFPGITLAPGEVYRSRTTYRFSTDD